MCGVGMHSTSRANYYRAKVNYASRPYLAEMMHLNTLDDACGHDSAKSIVLYFLANASSYRGAKAKALKAELKTLCGMK